jgi:hypothetical protein
MIQQYYVFRFDNYYPRGGWDDFKGAYVTIEEARKVAQAPGCDEWQIVDSSTNEIVEERH